VKIVQAELKLIVQDRLNALNVQLELTLLEKAQMNYLIAMIVQQANIQTLKEQQIANHAIQDHILLVLNLVNVIYVRQDHIKTIMAKKHALDVRKVLN